MSDNEKILQNSGDEIRRTVKSVAEITAHTEQEVRDIWQRIKDIPPKVTVCILAYNAQKYIVETLESVLGQSEENIEVIVRDNGSTDDTGKIIADYAAIDPRIVFLQNKVNYKNNDGSPLGYEGYNVYSDGYVSGVRRGDGEYITLLDSDDVWHRDYIKELYQEGQKNHADIVVAGSYFFNDGEFYAQKSRKPSEKVYHKGDTFCFDEFAYTYGSLRPQWGKLYRNQFYRDNIVLATERNNHADIGAAGDTLFVFTMVQRAQCMVCINAAYHYYRVKSTGTGMYRSLNNNGLFASSAEYNLEKEFSRIRQCDVLYDAGVEVAKYLGLTGDNTIDFLAEVHFFSLYDIVEIYHYSSFYENSNIEVFFRLVEVILNNRIFLQSFRKKVKYSLLLLELVTDFRSSRSMSLEKGLAYMPVRLEAVLKKQLPLNTSAMYTFLLISLLDERLDPRYGTNLLRDLGDSNESMTECGTYGAYLQAKLSYFCGRCKNEMSGDRSDIIKLKQEILDAIDEGDYPKADGKCEIILEQLPADREALYFKMYLSKLTGDTLAHRSYAIIAEYFWKEDADIMEMAK